MNIGYYPLECPTKNSLRVADESFLRRRLDYSLFSFGQMKPNAVKGYSINGVQLVQSNSGFVISRDGKSVHLTVCYNLKRNSLDCHFTNQETKQIVSRYECSLKTLEELAMRFHQELPLLFQKYFKKINYGKLGRNGWLVANPRLMNWDRLIESSSKIRKRKRYFNYTRLRRRFGVDLLSSFSHPSEIWSLNEEELEQPLWLVGTRKKNRHKQRFLLCICRNGCRKNYLFNPYSLITILSKPFLKKFDMARVEGFMNHFEKYIGFDFVHAT